MSTIGRRPLYLSVPTLRCEMSTRTSGTSRPKGRHNMTVPRSPVLSCWGRYGVVRTNCIFEHQQTWLLKVAEVGRCRCALTPIICQPQDSICVSHPATSCGTLPELCPDQHRTTRLNARDSITSRESSLIPSIGQRRLDPSSRNCRMIAVSITLPEHRQLIAKGCTDCTMMQVSLDGGGRRGKGREGSVLQQGISFRRSAREVGYSQWFICPVRSP